MKVTALLPMKANSERVKGKNFKNFCGKPLYRWILDTLLDCNAIHEVVINTDSTELIKYFKNNPQNRIIVREREQELRGDHVSMNLILKDDIRSNEADVYIMTHATNPLLSVSTIEKAIDKFEQLTSTGKVDSMFGVTKFQTRFYSENGEALNHDPSNLIRTQDLPPMYEENSCIYLFTEQSFRSTNARIGRKPALFEIPKLEAFDIDENEDWFIASAIAKGRGDLSNYA